ncbi:MAG: helix-turn-helix domain-containing protein [Caulobacteraceae bacterium]|nr:helix-turn-helix domain-containing protein [Caulobacteraceae bacterium]
MSGFHQTGQTIVKTDSPWLTRDEAASYLGLSPKTLAGWASEGKGPRSRKLGPSRPCRVRYRIEDLDHWVEKARSTNRSSLGPLS